MATPSAGPRPHATSTPTPKAHHGSTPSSTHLTSPAAVAMARQLSATHRSPSTKTPNYSANLSVSSQPSATPVGASATPLGTMHLGEDGAGLNSPAVALFAGMGGHGTGLTPAAGVTPLGMGGVGDGLGISNASDLPMGGPQVDGAPSIKDPDAEKDRRLNDILTMLRTRVAGRGVCREAVERIAQLSGFTFLWQDDTLTIAGNSVDLEIDFFPNSERVRDVSLKIAMNAEGDAEAKQEASDVLKEDLTQDAAAIGWKSMDAFSINLERLGRLDKLSQTNINCFEAVEGLYESFQKIWLEEKKKMPRTGPLTRLSRGGIGRPVMHKGRRLGLGVEYWAARHAFIESGHVAGSANEINTDDDEPKADHGKDTTIWSGRVECETGYPSLRVSSQWVSVDLLLHSGGESLADALPGAWLEPPSTLTARDENEMDTGGPGSVVVPTPPEVRFVFELEPAVLLPFQVAADFFEAVGITLPRDRIVTKDMQGFVKEWLDGSKRENSPLTSSTLVWEKSLWTMQADETMVQRRYNLNFNTTGPIWCSSIRSIPFEHPRQIGSLLPILRQYALLWTLVKNTITVAQDTKLVQDLPKVASYGLSPVKKSQGSKKRNNVNQQRAKLAALLNDKRDVKSVPSIEMTLRLSLDHPPRPLLELRFPLRRDLSQLARDAPAFASITVEVSPNGRIQVPKTENISFAQSLDERRKLAKIIELGEDLVLVVAKVHDGLEEDESN